MQNHEDARGDIVLIERIVARDEAAVAELYDRHCRLLFGLILRIIRDRSEAEEILQEVFVLVWTRAQTYNVSLGPPAAWLVRVARNRAIDRLRARGRRIMTPLDTIGEPADESASALDCMIETEGETRIEYCLGRLSDGDATLIRTAFYEGATYSELAERSRQPLGTIKSRIRRAFLKLRECLG